MNEILEKRRQEKEKAAELTNEDFSVADAEVDAEPEPPEPELDIDEDSED
jgi:hypothetical protein